MLSNIYKNKQKKESNLNGPGTPTRPRRGGGYYIILYYIVLYCIVLCYIILYYIIKYIMIYVYIYIYIYYYNI